MIVVNDLLFGGVQRIIVDLVNRLDKNLFEILIVYHKDEHTVSIEKEPKSFVGFLNCIGVKTICLDGERKWTLREVNNLRIALNNFRPDIIHTFLPYAGFWGRVVGRVCGYRHIVSTLCNLPVSLNKKNYYLERLTLFLAEARIVAAEGIGFHYGGILNTFSLKEWKQGGRRFLIPAGVDCDLVEKTIEGLDKSIFKKELNLPVDCFVVTMIARMVSWKGHLDLIKATTLLPERVHLLLVGDGKIKRDLEFQASELGLSSRVHFLGTRDDTYKILGISDVYVQSFSRKLNGTNWMGPNTSQMEAGAAGIPMVSTNIPLISYLIRDDVSGKLAELNNPQDLARAINWILGHPAQAKQLAEEARKIVRERYSLKAMSESYKCLYLDLARD